VGRRLSPLLSSRQADRATPPAARRSGDGPLSLDPASVDPAPDVEEGPPSVVSEISRARATASRLIAAHVALARAELALIGDRAKVAVALLGMALGLVLFAGMLATFGTPLFLGEWLFGSMGWGILHGVLFGLAVAVAAVMLALDLSPDHVFRTLVGAVLVGIVVGGVLFFNAFHALWAILGDEVAARTTLSIDPAVRPLVMGAVVVGALGALIGLILGIARGRSFSAAVGGLVAGAVAGAAFGAFTAITFSEEVAVAIGIAVALVTWMPLVARPVITGTYDWEALKSRYWPGLTVEMARETYEQLRGRMPDMPAAPKMPGRPGRRAGGAVDDRT
jgi:hypothetical protein